MQAIIKVLVLPPSESFSNQVSLESQYGTNLDPFSVKILMQEARANRDLLIFDPSSLYFYSLTS